MLVGPANASTYVIVDGSHHAPGGCASAFHQLLLLLRPPLARVRATQRTLCARVIVDDNGSKMNGRRATDCPIQPAREIHVST